MKINLLIISLILSLFAFSNSSYAQKCNEFHKSPSCKIANIQGFKLSSLSRSNSLEVGKTMKYEVVLYGSKEVMLSFCALKKYGPLRFKIMSSINGDVIYDNKYDNYRNSISLSLDRTELVSIEITLVSTQNNKNILEGTKACVGMAIYTQEAKIKQ